MDIITFLESKSATPCTIKTIMESEKFKVKQITSCIFIIKYKIDCDNYEDLWAIQCRGVTLLYENGWHVIKLGLLRSKEIYTQYHLNNGIHKIPKTEIEMICQDKQVLELNATLSAKIDGALLCVSVYPRQYYLTDIIMEQVSDYVYDYPEYDFIVILSTMNTFTITNEITNNYIKKALDSNILDFISKVNLFWQLFSRSPMTICFETVCENRIGLDSVEHTEFAVSYSSSFYKFLSYTDLTDLTIYYHHQVAQNIFLEPDIIKINTNRDLELALQEKKQDPEGYIIYYKDMIYKVKTMEYYWSHNEKKDWKSAENMYHIGLTNGNLFPNSYKFCKSYTKFRNILSNLRSDIENILTSSFLDAIEPNLVEKMQTFSNKRKLMIIFNSNKNLDNSLIAKYFKNINYNPKYFREFLCNLYDGITFEKEYEFYLLYKKYKKLCKEPTVLGAYIFGCPLSTDIDVAVVLQNLDDIGKHVSEKTIRNFIDADPNKKLDVCYICIENLKGSIPTIKDNCTTPSYRISKVSKGGKEIQNMIVKTWAFHKQKYQLILEETHVDLFLQDKIMALFKFVIDNFADLVCAETYKKYANFKKESYNSYLGKLDFVKTIYPEIVNDHKNYDIIKSIAMKSIQILIFPVQIYDKIGLAQKIDELYPNTYDAALYALFRGQEGIKDVNFVSFLFSEVFSKITQDTYNLNWISIIPNLINPTILLDSTFQEFIKSPIVPTQKFIQEYGSSTINNIIPGFAPTSVNKMFISDNQNIDLFPISIIEKHIIDVKQKSQEWLELNKFYRCGLNTGINKFTGDDSFVSSYYNLIRGAIGEQIVSNTLSQELLKLFPGAISINKIFVGMIVAKKEFGAEGASPDMILQVNYQDKPCIYVPVEIKCHDTELRNNKDMRRYISLATRQLQTTSRLLELPIKIGLMLLLSMTETNISLDGALINL